MPTLPNMSLVTPTQGGDSGTWDDKINAAFALVDAHDHTSGKGVQVPVSGLNINADLSMAGYGLTNVGRVAFTAVTALASGSKALFVSSADNELYWRTNGGTNVKLTSGTTINTSLVGGIVGDYTSVGAEVAFVDASKVYTFKDQNSPKRWARLAAGDVRIYEYNTSETVYVALKAAAALGSSYDITFPTALPAGGFTPVGIDSTGALDFTGVFGSNVSMTLVGTGDYKHGEKCISMDAYSRYAYGTGTVSAGVSSDAIFSRIAGGTGYAIYALAGVRAGKRIKAVKMRASSANEPTVAIYTQSGATATARANTRTNSIPANGCAHYALDTPYTLTGDITTGLTVGDALYIRVTAGAGDIDIYQFDVIYDHP